MRANVDPDRERLLDDLATLEAPLRGEARRYFDNPYTSFFRFEYEDVLESGPTRVGNGACEMAVFEQVLDAEVFHGNESVLIHVATSDLVRAILALACNLEMRSICENSVITKFSLSHHPGPERPSCESPNTGGYCQCLMYDRLCCLDTLHKITCWIGPVLCRILQMNFYEKAHCVKADLTEIPVAHRRWVFCVFKQSIIG